ncbi:hypothetical protein ACSFA3_16360 [Variovorax sp. RHLX14]|uniref:hypothetical protein n=1 Tax=Variovorax sp. RHLX14 TaxID=1259731 RepID=UPI003F44D790
MKPVVKAHSTRHAAWNVAAVVLVLANVVYFAWSQGAFAVFGAQPERFTQTEPQRMARQVNPTLLRVLKEAPPVPSPDAAPAEAPISDAAAISEPPTVAPSTVDPTDRTAR